LNYRCRPDLRPFLSLSVFLFAASALAGLDGDTVNLKLLYPTQSDVFADLGNQIVNGSIEYAEGSFPSDYGAYFSLQITNTQVIFKWNADATFVGSFGNPTFNGLAIEDFTSTLTSAVAASGSDFSPSGISIADNTLYLNYSGVGGLQPGYQSVVNLTTAAPVPEPLTTAFSLAGVGLAVRKRMQKPGKANRGKGLSVD
jgi:hypothetical protein